MPYKHQHATLGTDRLLTDIFYTFLQVLRPKAQNYIMKSLHGYGQVCLPVMSTYHQIEFEDVVTPSHCQKYSFKKKLNIKICIEGVETEDEWEKIRLLDPDYSQGYLWGKPCSFDELLKKGLRV